MFLRLSGYIRAVAVAIRSIGEAPVTVTQLQTRLAALGFGPGPVDGAIGRRTRAAILAFQQSRGLDADGIAGAATLAALGAAHPPLASPLAVLALP